MMIQVLKFSQCPSETYVYIFRQLEVFTSSQIRGLCFPINKGHKICLFKPFQLGSSHEELLNSMEDTAHDVRAISNWTLFNKAYLDEVLSELAN